MKLIQSRKFVFSLCVGLLFTSACAGATPATLPPTLTPLPTATLAPLAPVGEVAGSWTLKFNDEFDGNALDTTKWRTCYDWGCLLATNNELQCYVPENVVVGEGLVRLKAERRSVPCMVDGQARTQEYASGMISSDPAYTFTYGYVEIRSKGIQGKGLWPALWMIPHHHRWPPEFDILELLGDSANVARFNYWYGDGTQSPSKYTGPDFSADWHIFGMYWGSDAIRYYVDGEEQGEAFTDTANITDVPEYFVANLAVGGNWPGAPNAATVFPNYYEIDYVRIWQQ